MGVEATVLIPTHNHGELLRRSVESALRQTVAELEVMIVGDGTDELTREVALSLCAQDPRVRFFDNPKGPRHGEVHRHRALQHSSGRIVCYLADDDLWLSEHVESMSDLLRDADFGHSLAFGIRPNGEVESWVGHLDSGGSRQALLDYRNFIPFSCGAHTMAVYNGLPYGWRTTPDGIHTDVYMWSQILSQPNVTAKTSDRATVLHFPSSWRTEQSVDERLYELDSWGGVVQSADAELRLSRALMEYLARERASVDEHVSRLLAELEKRQLEVETLQVQIEEISDALSSSTAETESLERDVRELRQDLNHTANQKDEAISDYAEAAAALEECLDALHNARWTIRWMQNSLTWRIRSGLLATPAIGSAIRKVGEVRSRGEAR